MKLLSLKRALYPAIMLVGLASIVGISAKTQCNSVEVSQAYAQLENLLYTCIFNQKDTRPLSYFVHQVTDLVNKHHKDLAHRIPVQVLEHLVQDLNKALEINLRKLAS